MRLFDDISGIRLWRINQEQSDNDIYFLANLVSRHDPLGLVYTPCVYVRIPDADNTVYTRVIHRGCGHLNFIRPYSGRNF